MPEAKFCPNCGARMRIKQYGIEKLYVCLECCCISRGEFEYGKD